MLQDVDVASRIPGERSSAPLTVLNIAFPLAPVGPDAVGGAEQVLTALDEALVRAGHRSIVLACEGSACRGELVATPNWSKKGDNELHELDEETWQEAHRCYRSALQDALRRFVPEVLHFHGVDFAAYLPPPGPRTGFLVSDVAEMAEAISAVEGIDPAECRRAAEERFSFTRTAEVYLGLYRRLAAESEPRDAAPAPAGEAHVVHAV